MLISEIKRLNANRPDTTYTELQKEIWYSNSAIAEVMALNTFAGLNHWGWNTKGFSFCKLLHPYAQFNETHDLEQSAWHWLFDHPEYFHLYQTHKRPKPIAIALQPYEPAYNSEKKRLTRQYQFVMEEIDRLGLEIVSPPNVLESFWSPPHTMLFLLVKKGTVVKWLDEQLVT